MECKTTRCFVAAMALLLATTLARADSSYVDVDAVTANGAISLDGSASYNASLHEWTLNLEAVNSSSQSFSDVLFLDDFIFDETSKSPDIAFSFDNMTDVWSTSSHTWQLLNPTNSLLMSDTNVPLSETRDGATATLNSTDSSPYINVGPIGAFATVPFTEFVHVDSKYAFDIGGSFISQFPVTPIPEPSTLALVGLGLISAIPFVLRRGGMCALRAGRN